MTETTTPRQVFLEVLQAALQDLYNPAALRKNPLLVWLAAEAHDPLAVTRKRLTDAIKGLKPSETVPYHANVWRLYHILTYRYVEQLTQKEVAAELALSVRQLRRLEYAALDVLADALWRRNDVAEKVTAHVQGMADAPSMADAPQDIAPSLDAARPSDTGVPHRTETPPDQADELAWLKASLPSETVAVPDVVASVLQTLAPLAELNDVDVYANVSSELPLMQGPRAPLRQALLNLLSAAVQAAPGGEVRVQGDTGPAGIHIHVRAMDTEADCRVEKEIAEKLAMTRQLCALFGAELHSPAPTVTPDEQEVSAAGLSVTLVLPAVAQVPVLVIDDNADALKLLARYMEGTRYTFTGTRDPDRALELAAEIAPQVILLDVMLPGIDGWELLGRLRAHPYTQDIPVLVCTILPQAQLALALGAAGFLRKPVSREGLLSALTKIN